MFVSKTRFTELQRQYNYVVSRHNDVVDLCEQLHSELKTQAVSSQFTQQELKSLVRLCHPDKHNGKQIANDLTAKLLDLIEKSK